jgi:hypothetical protein
LSAAARIASRLRTLLWQASLSRRRQAAQAACDAHSGAIAEIDAQLAATRQRLTGIDEQIASEAAADLAAGLEAEVAAIRIAADELNRALGRALGLRIFALSKRGNHAFARLAERISALRTPEIGATVRESEAAAKDWERRFAGMAE